MASLKPKTVREGRGAKIYSSLFPLIAMFWLGQWPDAEINPGVDSRIWQMDKVKTTKKGSKAYGYCMAALREGGKMRNIPLRSCAKMDAEAVATEG